MFGICTERKYRESFIHGYKDWFERLYGFFVIDTTVRNEIQPLIHPKALSFATFLEIPALWTTSTT